MPHDAARASSAYSRYSFASRASVHDLLDRAPHGNALRGDAARHRVHVLTPAAAGACERGTRRGARARALLRLKGQLGVLGLVVNFHRLRLRGVRQTAEPSPTRRDTPCSPQRARHLQVRSLLTADGALVLCVPDNSSFAVCKPSRSSALVGRGVGDFLLNLRLRSAARRVVSAGRLAKRSAGRSACEAQRGGAAAQRGCRVQRRRTEVCFVGFAFPPMTGTPRRRGQHAQGRR